MVWTTTQLAMLAVLFVAGWFLGLASHPGGRKWRERYAAERDAHAAARKEADARVTAADQRTTTVERQRDQLASAPAAVATPVVAHPSAIRPVVGNAAARRTYPDGRKRGWFDWG